MEGAVVSASMGVIGPLLAEITILCARLPEGRPKTEMEFFEEKLRSIQEMVSSLHAVKMSHMVEEDTLLKKRWAKQAREIAYDTQDFVDLFSHGAGLSLSDDAAGVMPKTAGRLKKLRRFSTRPKKPRLDREMVNKVEELKARMAEVIERHKRFKIAMEPSSPKKEDMPGCSGHQIQIQSEASSSSTSRSPTVSIDAYFSALYAGGDGLVGIDGPSDDLTALLMDDMQQLKVVSVLGPEGIGKTTLVREVYRNIRGRFECCAFVSMSPKTGIQEILQAFRSQLGAQDGASVEACQEERLTHKLIQVLTGKRYFVVLDGVWSTRAWRLIRCALPGNNHGSRILMTTCIDNIAKSCCSTTGDSIYQVKCLPELEGRRLFIERTFGLEKWQFPSWLKEVSSEISRTCGGWPIVILTIASLLATKSSSEDHWKMIQGSIGLALVRPHRREGLALEQSQVHICDSLQGVKNILHICYNDLPQHLKTCLLYLSIYPEGYVIGRDHLIRRWIAEGFISVRSEHDNLEEVGQCYFNELINRGMIQPVGIQYDGRADACQVHSLILSLIVSISVEENFVTLFDGQAHELGTTDKVRRLSLNYHGQQHFSVPSTITASPVRSLTLFGSAQGAPIILSNSRALRVLDLDVQGDPCKKYLGTVGSFFQLKYLGLQMSGVVELPEQIGELQFLETLDLTKTSIRKLPRSILRLWRLVYLLVCNVELPDGVGDMRSLEELSGIQVSNTNSTNSLLGVGQLTKLRTVQLIWSISDACGDIKGYEDNLLSSLKELSKLQSLSIESRDGSALSFLDSWSPHPQLLQKLYLTGGYYFPRIPERIISLVNLDFLDIKVYQVQDEMMNVLGSLPALLVLSLSSQVAAPEQRIVVQPGLFHCLTKFTLICLNSWTGLVIEPEALPRLARLGLLCYMQGQRNPVCGDYGIKCLSSLKNLHVEITLGRTGIWKVATRSPKSSPPQVQISDKHHMVEEAEIIEAVESLSAHESIEEESAIYKDAKMLPQPPMYDVEIFSKKMYDVEMDFQSSQESPEVYDMSPRIHPHKLTSASSELAFHNRETMEVALVSVATGVLKPILEKLAALLGDEYKHFKGVRKEIESLTHELAAMEAFLLKMSEEEDPDVQDKIWMNEVRELSYDMEDAIDDFMQSVGDKDEKPDGFIEKIKSSLVTLGKMKARRRIGKEILDLKKQITEAGKRNARHRTGVAISNTINATVDPRALSMFEHASNLVGIDEPKDELIKLLAEEDGCMVSIVGSGGMGKTTLANQVYQELKGQYECQAFISVSRNPNMTNILRTILSKVSTQRYADTEEGSVQQLIIKITEFLLDKKYFIVVDDIWDTDTWDVIKHVFPKTGFGSRIITTTRINDVAQSCCSFFSGHVYRMKPLNMVHSRQLFHRRLFNSEEDCLPYKEISDQILKKCDGLPLAIIALSGLLVNKEKTEHIWNQVKDSIGRALERNPTIQVMMKILALSYFDLPPSLKTCFLYLSIFPEDSVIKRKGLIKRWIGEGFIHKDDIYTAEEIGEMCFNELINRNLIQPGGFDKYNKVMNCRVHDTILDFIISKSVEENFVTLVGVPYITIGTERKVRRISLQVGKKGSCILPTSLELCQVRSLNVFGNSALIPSLDEFRHLRILDFEGCRELENQHLAKIGSRLFQLRRLNLRKTRVSELPGQIGHLGCLEMLDLRGTSVRKLPASIVNLRRLIHLFVGIRVKFPGGIAKMQALETLKRVCVIEQQFNFLQELGQLKNLRKLVLYFGGDASSYAERETRAKKDLIASFLSKLGMLNLGSLTIWKDECSFLVEPWCAAPFGLRKLMVHEQVFRQVPNWVGSHVYLQEVLFEVEWFTQEDVCNLGSLPALLILNLTLTARSKDRIIVSDAVGFPCLRELRYHRVLFGGMDLLFAPGSMPKLEKLDLLFNAGESDSLSTEAFDLGIGNLPSLTSVKCEVRGWLNSAVSSAKDYLERTASTHPNHPTLLLA